MPMIWNAEADAKLMAHILQACDAKLSGAQMKEIATLMGPECTPKAIAHRMTFFRKMAGGGGTTKTGDAPKGRGGGKGRKGRKGGEEKGGDASPEAGEEDDEAGSGEHLGTAAKTVTGKRGREAEDGEEGDVDDAVHEGKKIKVEVGEEEGDIEYD
ncbi:hypothetical protein BDY17DRAFT_130526 [Neohortaea acidophila]|uniref:Uncharacterized protein n=1 Tax=Neohortaea acidophila TaxID=245834 RepID=A0A6A6PXR3_9PEZI|nr:uncharacterized protein BDY17DRAFT_130526 [Neohortaea acidophila]KAF2484541.1 hypothetical protein BDY17DRAFT_130526 [Neohortaea acidophila]